MGVEKIIYHLLMGEQAQNNPWVLANLPFGICKQYLTIFEKGQYVTNLLLTYMI